LAAEHLGLTIQAGEHSPVDDARAALYLYLRFRRQWDAALKAGGGSGVLRLQAPGSKGGCCAGAAASLAALAAGDDMAEK
jgi:hypothetical protein